jgi:signal peptidase I
VSEGKDRSAWLLGPLAAVLIALLLVFFVFFHFTTVDGDSMKPTLLNQDRLLLTKGYPHPRRDDIVVFTLKENGTPTELVKRVVGIPGDTVYCKGDLAWVNGKPEPRGFDVLVGPSTQPVGPVTVRAGEVFVLGDNRAIALDSRIIGPVPLSSVVGRAVAVFAPLSRLRLLRPPSGGA